MSIPNTSVVHHSNLKAGEIYLLSQPRGIGEAWVKYDGDLKFTVREGCLVKRSTQKRFPKGTQYTMNPEMLEFVKFYQEIA